MTAVWVFLGMALFGTLGITVTRSGAWTTFYGTLALAGFLCCAWLWPLVM